MSAWEVVQWSLAVLVVTVCAAGVAVVVWLAVEISADAIKVAVRKRAAKRDEDKAPES